MVLNKNKNRLKQKDDIFREWQQAQKIADSVGEEIRICKQLMKVKDKLLIMKSTAFHVFENETLPIPSLPGFGSHVEIATRSF